MSEWPEKPLGDLLELIIDHRGKTPKKMGGTDFTPAGVPVVSAIHIKHGRIEWAERERYVPPWMFEKWMPVRLRRGDVLLTSEAPLGEVAQVPSDDDLVLSQRLFGLRGHKDRLDSSFLRYFFESREGRAKLLSRASGTTVVGIRQAELVKVPIPVPPLREQRRIAAVLGAFDELTQANRVLVSRFREQATRAYEYASRDGAVVPLGDLADLIRDGVRAEELTAGAPYVGLEHFGTEGAGLAGIGDAGSVDSNKSRFRAGDVLYGKLRPYFRKFDRPGFDGVCSTEIWVLRPKPGWGGGTLNAIVARQEFTDFAMAGSGGTRMPRADWSHVRSMPVAVPAPEVRAGVERNLDRLWRAQVALREEISALTRARDELLPLLMSRRVRVQDVEGRI